MASLDEIAIRTDIRPGDMGMVVHLHGALYHAEYGYGLEFERYVAEGVVEFWKTYDPTRDRVWLCEHGGRLVGSLFLVHRGGDVAQLRYFLIRPEYRSMGLGGKLMRLFMECLRGRGYKVCYLWTTAELCVAAVLYRKNGFVLVEEKESALFGKPVREQKYELRALP